MADFVAELAGKAGVSPELAGKGVGAVLALLKDRLPSGAFAQVQSAVPNADALMSAAAAKPEASGGGMLAAAAGAVGKLFGGGGAAETTGKLAQLGFTPEQLGKFLPTLLEFFKSRLPPEVMKQLSALLPAGSPAGAGAG
jgi:hypothetical protein